MTTKFRPIIFLSIALLVSFAAEVRACQCAEYETPTCANYWRAGYVFIARVKSINRDPARPYSLPPGVVAGSTMTSKYKTAYLEIERVLRGEINGEVLDFVSEGSDCLIEYKRGASISFSPRHMIHGLARLARVSVPAVAELIETTPVTWLPFAEWDSNSMTARFSVEC